MTAELIIKAVNDIDPGDHAQINGFDVRRWISGTGWTIGAAPYHNVVGLSSLPAVVRMLAKGRPS